MARQRKGQTQPITTKSREKSDKSANSSSSNGSSLTDSSVSSNNNVLSYWKQLIVCLVLSIAVSFGYMGYLETRINTPFDDKRVVVKTGLDVPDVFWGTYRPGLYFGLKTRDPHSLVTGLMWYFPRRLGPGGDGIRHWCEQGDNLQRYGWLQHDGRNFGIQEIIDKPFKLITSFVKRPGGSRGGDWTARIAVEKDNRTKSEEVSLIWYVALDEETKGYIEPTNSGTKITGIKGFTSVLDKFTLKLTNISGTLDHESFLSTATPGLHLLKETVIQSLRLQQTDPKSPRRIVLAGQLQAYDNSEKVDPNLVAIQLTGIVPFTVDIAFKSASSSNEDNFIGDTYTKAFELHKKQFEEKFDKKFDLKSKGYKNEQIVFAQASLSNMLGGIGYFYGASTVQSIYTSEPVNYWRTPLYTAVPSRSFFPRGFLWDEGFHGLLISQWDVDMELDIMSHWFDLMNVEGWIPRELILGVEALAKVPSEFVVQRNTNANPPTFFLTLDSILERYQNDLTEERWRILERLYPRLQAWFLWFNTTQKGTLPGSYRWRGRDGETTRELNPKTLASGLDDFPRASHPTQDERHIDLYCWITLAVKTLYKLSKIIGADPYRYEQTLAYLSDNDLMNKLHWSEFSQSYADYGLHTDDVRLERPKPLPRQQDQNMEMQRVVLKKPEYRLVDSTFGYVNLFPFLLEILEPDSRQLGKILTDLRKPELLWTPFGLRSLATTAPLYNKRNTEHDPPYWRGKIWININFLVTRALYKYSQIKGPYQEQAQRLYKELRENLINNIMKQYFKSGYIWEQYDESTGEGSGCRPFNGWTALVVTIMGEHY